MTLPTLIQYLLVALIVVGIVAVLRLWSVLGSARVTLANLETTRLEVSETLKRMDTTLATTEQVMREEVAPTLRAARATLDNVEVTTRALAETTSALRRLTGKAESVTDTRRLLSAGGALFHLVTHRNGKPANAEKPAGNGLFSGLALGIGARVAGLLTRHRPQRAAKPALPPAEAAPEAPPKAKRKQKALPRGDGH